MFYGRCNYRLYTRVTSFQKSQEQAEIFVIMSAAGAVKKIVMWTLLFVLFLTFVVQCAHKNGDLSLWIDEQQVKMFSGFSMEIYAIVDGHVLPYILDPKFEQYLPIIPSEVGSILNMN
ncbi:unnamed protein product [Timema podura]|uniref:WIF domain-containing protein n=1 Tax=Timema podura TaxID=61482 RepID=A0ABN7PAC6_TIMPD|nr:unnamed protein product [Timema podura]